MMFFVGLFAWLFAIIAVGAAIYGVGVLLYRNSKGFRDKLEAYYETLPQYWEDDE